MVLALFCSACGQPQDKLVGTWVIDAEGTSVVEDMPLNVGALVGALELDLTVTADRMTINLFGNKKEGPYEVIQHDNGRYEVEVQADGTKQRFVLTLKDDRLVFAGEGEQVALKRKEES